MLGINASILTHQGQYRKWLIYPASLAIAFFLLVVLSKQLWETKPQNWTFQTNGSIDWHPIRGGNFGPISFSKTDLHISNLDGYTYAIDPETGRERWRFRSDEYTIYDKATDRDSMVFISDFDGRTYAIDRNTGKEIWRFVTPKLIKADTEPIVSGDLIYFGSRNGVFYALNKRTGKEKWQFKTRGIDHKRLVKDETIIHFGTFVVDEKQVYINSSSNNAVYALDKITGEEKWQFKSYYYVNEKPLLGTTTITFRSNDGYFFTLDKQTGQPIWRWPAVTGQPQSVHVAGSDIYYVDEENTLYKYSSGRQTNQALWKYHSHEFILDIREWLVISRDNIYFTTLSPDKRASLVALNDQTGKVEWQFQTDAVIPYIPQVNGDLVFVVSDSDLFALEQRTGKQQWRFAGSGKGAAVFVTDRGVYVVLLENEESVLVYFLDKETGTEKWSFITHDADTGTFTGNGGRLYFLTEDRKSIVSLKNNNAAMKVVDQDDIRRIASSDRTIQGGSKAFVRKISQPIKELVVVPLVQITGSFDEKRKVKVITEEREIDRYDVYELVMKHEDSFYKNPWEEVKISAEFQDESGERSDIKGFYYDKNTWKLRFAPPTVGVWSWKLTFESPVTKIIKKGAFLATDAASPGFVRLHPKNPYRFIFDNGDLFVPLGLQDCFLDHNHTGNLIDQLGVGFKKAPNRQAKEVALSDLESYLEIYGPEQAGFNLFRFNVDNCSEKLWRNINPSGSYFGINAGMRGDKLVKTLKKNNYRIWMSLFSFELPLQGSVKDSDYRKALKSYIDYVVARYTSYVDIWELANEISLDDEWIAFTAEYLRSIDPYNHPITVNWERPDLSQIEINSIHWYDSSGASESDLIAANIISQAKKWEKPVVFSEVGNTDVNWDKHSALRMRLKLWTAFFNEASLVFWNTSMWLFEHEGGSANIYLGPEERAYTRVFHEFIKSLDADITQATITVEDDEIRANGLKSDEYMLAYIHNGRSHTQKADTIIKFKLEKDGILQWIDPKTGRMLESQELSAGDKSLQTPRFKIDLAMKIAFHDQ